MGTAEARAGPKRLPSGLRGQETLTMITCHECSALDWSLATAYCSLLFNCIRYREVEWQWPVYHRFTHDTAVRRCRWKRCSGKRVYEKFWESKLQVKSWQPIDCKRTNMQPPVLGEIQAKVMYCSGLSADNPSLNHQDPFIHPYGSQLTANQQPAMWSRGPVSRLLRQVGLTVDIFWLPVSTRVHFICGLLRPLYIMKVMIMIYGGIMAQLDHWHHCLTDCR